MPRFSLSGFFGLFKCLVPSPVLTSEYLMCSVCVCMRILPKKNKKTKKQKKKIRANRLPAKLLDFFYDVTKASSINTHTLPTLSKNRESTGKISVFLMWKVTPRRVTSNKCLAKASEPSHRRLPPLMNKLRIYERTCTLRRMCSQRRTLVSTDACVAYTPAHTHLYWCPRHLFSACHTHHIKCTYICACTSWQRCSIFFKFAMKTSAKYLESWKLSPDRQHSRQIKRIELNHHDALAEPNVQRRAWWFNTQTDCAAPAHHCWSKLLYLFTAPLPTAQETIKIHTSAWCSRGCVVAQASSDHPRSTGCGPHPARLWLALVAYWRHYSSKNCFLSFFLGWRNLSLITRLCGWWGPNKSSRTQETVPDRCRLPYINSMLWILFSTIFWLKMVIGVQKMIITGLLSNGYFEKKPGLWLFWFHWCTLYNLFWKVKQSSTLPQNTRNPQRTTTVTFSKNWDGGRQEMLCFAQFLDNIP